MSIFTVLFVFLCLVLLFNWVLVYWAVPRLRLTRSFLKPVVFCGEQSEMLETLVNDGPFLIPWIRVESRISPYLQFGKQENLDVRGDMYHCSLFSVMPYQRIIRHHQVRFLRRGIYNVGSCAMTAGDITGFFHASREQQLDMHVTVLPRILDEQELPYPLQQLAGSWCPERRLLHDPFLIRNIRDYFPGDPVRDIHWAATARTQKLQVKIYDDEAQTRFMVIICSQTREDQWDDLMDYEQDQIEYLISVAATLTSFAVRRGIRTGFAANMPYTGEPQEQSAVMLPDLHPTREEEILSRLAALRIHRTLRFPSFLKTLSYEDETDYLILSCYTSDELEEAIAGLSEKGYSVRLEVLGGINS